MSSSEEDTAVTNQASVFGLLHADDDSSVDEDSSAEQFDVDASEDEKRNHADSSLASSIENKSGANHNATRRPEDNINTLMTSMSGVSLSASQKEKKSRSKAKKVNQGDDIDSLLAELKAPVKSTKPKTKETKTATIEAEKKSSTLNGVNALMNAFSDSDEESNSEDESSSDEDESEEEVVVVKAKTKKTDTKSSGGGAIAALRARREKEQAERDAVEKKRLEAIEAAQERNRQEEMKEKERMAQREKRAEEKRRKKEAAIKAGTHQTKAAKAKAARAKEQLDMMRAQGLMIADKSNSSSTTQSSKKKPKKLNRRQQMALEAQKNAAMRNEEKMKLDALKKLAEETAGKISVDVEEIKHEEKEKENVVVVEDTNNIDQEWELLSASVSEESSGSLVSAWDIDSEEETRLKQEKIERRAKRAAEREQREQRRVLLHRKRLEQIKMASEQHDKQMAKLEAEKFKRAKEERLRKAKQQQRKIKEDFKEQDTADDETASDQSQCDSAAEQSKADSRARRQKRRNDALEKSKTTPENLRSPICCILGHVDTGKTKILDRIRSTKVQDAEAGGITQQIGASYFPMTVIEKQTEEINASREKELQMRVPGLLIIDTPGHESFTNLRARGSSLCDIAILVVDIMHALEPQTIESLNLLRNKGTPFVVALNKIDRAYGWKPRQWSSFTRTIKDQSESTVEEFEMRMEKTITAFQEQGLNCALYTRNKDFKRVISIVPTSAITGEGLPDLLMLLVQLTQKMMSGRLRFISDVLECTVLEVKIVDGIGTTIDVVLSNGMLHVGDTIVVCGLSGPIVTTVRALLTPQPLAELRVKGEYQRLKMVKAAAGIKLVAPGLDDAVSGSQLLVYEKGDDIEDLKDEVMGDLASILSKVDKSGRGVCVQASTLGSLEALLQFLSDSKIPVSGIAIGPVHRKDVLRSAIMLEHQKEYAVILAFDVKVTADAKVYAQQTGVQIFTAKIIYHLFDQFTKYMDNINEVKQEQAADVVVFPTVLSIMPDCVFRQKDPIIIGVKVVEGILRKGCPLCLAGKTDVDIGVVSSIQANHKEIQQAKKGEEVCVKIETTGSTSHIAYGRHFDSSNELYSKISRQSIDALKSNFKDVLSKEDWRLVIRLKQVFDIQ